MNTIQTSIYLSREQKRRIDEFCDHHAIRFSPYVRGRLADCMYRRDFKTVPKIAGQAIRSNLRVTPEMIAAVPAGTFASWCRYALEPPTIKRLKKGGPDSRYFQCGSQNFCDTKPSPRNTYLDTAFSANPPNRK